jgi:hypothetical protein
MNHPSFHLRPTGRAHMIAAVLLTLLAGAAAGAQTVDELQDELARTRDELRAAESLIATLREEVARLQAELRELRGEASIEPRADIPADPLACPDSMAAELTRRYVRDLAHIPAAEDGFEQAALEWCDRAAREVRGRREWLVSVADLAPEPNGRDHSARIRVYDELSLLPLGDSELVVVPGRFVPRLKAEPDAVLWLLTAEVSADPVYNPMRLSRGAFDEPAFVGPAIESGFALDWISLTSTEFVPTGENAPPEVAPVARPPAPGADR